MQSRVDFIVANARDRVLDVGFVACSLHQEIQKKVPKKDLFGVDIEPVPKSPNYKQASAEKIPFEAQFFDTVVAGELVEHLEKPTLFVREANRLLKKGGKLIITTPNRNSLVNRVTHCYHTAIHLSLFSIPELQKLLEENGFVVERLFCLPYNEESSPGSSQKWFYAVRGLLHRVLPLSLQEEIVVMATKKG